MDGDKIPHLQRECLPLLMATLPTYVTNDLNITPQARAKLKVTEKDQNANLLMITDLKQVLASTNNILLLLFFVS